jgi:ribosomal protein S18 acetylase RimI-like enzyme
MSAPTGVDGLWHTRAATGTDLTFLRRMLYEAATWRPGAARPPEDAVLADPRVAIYVEGWGRDGDAGVVAANEEERLGAAWYRSFAADGHGYGFVEPGVPELTIAVRREQRGRGIGTALLHDLVDRARVEGLAALSLSVEDDNPARRLYERAGFVAVGCVGNARTMRLELA